MRLPITPQLSTKDGVSAKNARLTNCLKESKKGGDKAVIRPGLVLSDTYSGIGNGLIPFDGRLLVIYDDTVYDIEEDSFPWPLDSAPWDAATTYGYGETVWYGGVLLFSQTSWNIGNTPGGSSTYWARSYETPEWDEDATYAIGDPVTYGGVTYYSYSDSNVGNTPTGTSSLWGTSAPPATRYECLTMVTGPVAATQDAAMETWWPLWYATVEHDCPGLAPYYIWYSSVHYRSGNTIYASQYGTAGVRPCGDPGNGPFVVGTGTITVA